MLAYEAASCPANRVPNIIACHAGLMCGMIRKCNVLGCPTSANHTKVSGPLHAAHNGLKLSQSTCRYLPGELWFGKKPCPAQIIGASSRRVSAQPLAVLFCHETDSPLSAANTSTRKALVPALERHTRYVDIRTHVKEHCFRFEAPCVALLPSSQK